MTTLSYPRNLSFSATFNFRDVGGYRGLDGRTVRWRRLFRSDALHGIGAADAQAFAALGIRTVVDLRRGFEVERHGRLSDEHGVEYRHLPLLHVDWEEIAHDGDLPHERWLADRYRNFVEQGTAALAGTLSVIAEEDNAPVVVHCMAGKDRTGVALALTLALLGVSDADIAADYALTAEAMAPLTAHLRTGAPDLVDGKDHMFSSPAEAMLLFLADLRETYGSPETYAHRIGVTDAQIESLRTHLLA
ncbi:MAG TPA: tyrosine-protein phosphatase [Actinoplanes sp.]|nr:tyrosine-protein phosphatase [Actinoplanes sp.]